jgi:hypothetical protein
MYKYSYIFIYVYYQDDLHVSLEGSDEAIEKALKELESVFYHPEQGIYTFLIYVYLYTYIYNVFYHLKQAFALKQEQLKNIYICINIHIYIYIYIYIFMYI